MHRSETISEVAEALAAFGADVTNPPQTKTAQVQTKSGASYSYGYADLADVLAHVRPALAGHGLTVTQEVLCRPDRVGVKTSVLHRSGEFIDFRPLWLPAPAEASPQAYGSAITYARRYSLLAALNLASATDDDGAAAAGPPARRNGSGRPATEKQLAKIRAIAREAGVTEEQLHAGARRDFGAESLAALSTGQASELIDRLGKLPPAAVDPKTGEVEGEPPGMDAEAFRASHAPEQAFEPWGVKE